MSLKLANVFGAVFLLASGVIPTISSGKDQHGGERGLAKRVLLISIDGMHALDFANCAKGLDGVNGGEPYCPTLAELNESGLTYVAASSSKPSDSFPGLIAEVTGGTPRSSGVFYDVSYDRFLSPPAQTTPSGIVGGKSLCPGTKGTIVGYDESIDYDLAEVNGGGGINPNYLPRDSSRGCSPVYPHEYLRVNTIFEVVKAHGGYTAWSDKHPAYDIVNGPSGKGVGRSLFTGNQFQCRTAEIRRLRPSSGYFCQRQ